MLLLALAGDAGARFYFTRKQNVAHYTISILPNGRSGIAAAQPILQKTQFL
jgi:hypothetical protein